MRRAVLVEPLKNLRVDIPGYEVVYLWYSYACHPHPFDPAFQAALEDRLAEVKFDPWDDHLVIAGHMATMAMTAATLARMLGVFKALVFDPREHKRQYEVVTFGVTHTGASI